MQEDRFDIDSESCHFSFWGEFLFIEKIFYSICSVYSEDFSPFYIFICIKHATRILTLSPPKGCPIYQVLLLFIFVNHKVSEL